MKNDEAIRMLVRLKDCINFEVADAQKKMDALNMAIEALEKQNCKDAISREEAIKWMENIRTLNKYYHPKEDDDETLVSEVICRLNQLPPVTTEKTAKRIKIQSGDKMFPKIIVCSNEEMSKKIAEKVLDGYIINGKTLREWIDILAQTKWIPVNERLPEDLQRVLVTIVRYSGNKIVRVAEYYSRNNGKGIFQIKENHEQWEVGEEGLLAWMPLPEPYKGVSE